MLKHIRHALSKAPFLVLAFLLLVACAAPDAGDTTVEDALLEDSLLETLPIPIEELLVYIPAGRFIMGSDPDLDPLAEEDEFPQRPVLLDGFFIYRNAVTNSLYQLCVEAGECTTPTIFEEGPSTKYHDPEYRNHPVVGVTWAQADAFCTWADSRLPSEAEWEKTARGEYGNIYPWGNDSPECSLSNMAGCFVDPEETDMVGQRPDGESYYEADDMSGNVWEWTYDWYDEEYYQHAPGMNPVGPLDGDFRVARGGSYLDGPEALRTAERLPLDPEESFNNVGFRCVPIGLPSAARAPFCQTSYVPFCRQPGGGEEDCGPLAQATPPGSPDYEFASFGCPQDGLVRIAINAGKPVGPDETVTVGGAVFTCVDSETTPGQWVCWGSPPPQGTLTTVQVCPSPNAGMPGDSLVAYGAGQPAAAPGLVGYQPPAPAGGDQLVAFAPAQPAQRVGLQAYQPPAVQQGLVAFQTTAGTPSNCAEGYIYNPTTGLCEQVPGGETGCPNGWTYDANTYSCIPSDQGCPTGTRYNPDLQTCQPDDGSTCPQGWRHDEATNSCQPPGNGDGGGCPAGYYFDNDINCCAPLTGDNLGCDAGYYRSVATNECVPLDPNGCEPGYVYNRYEGGCVPDYGRTQQTGTQCRLPGQVLDENGQCVPGDVPTGDCSRGSYYNPSTQQCEPLDPNGCQPGYRYDPVTQSCLPGDGPGSGCPAGYVYSERLNCCAPGPGTDGSSCLGDDPQTGRLTSFVAYPSQTQFDYGMGYCDPQGNGNGDSRSDQPGACPAGTYYDEGLGYCVRTHCGCELGSYYDPQRQTCIPYGGETQVGCWTYTVSVPVCPYVSPTPPITCPPGERYNPSRQQCEPSDDPEPTPGPGGGGGSGRVCASQPNQNACEAIGCRWVVSTVSYCTTP